METHKTCTRCHTAKPFEAFCRSLHGKYGVHSICRKCAVDYQRERLLREDVKIRVALYRRTPDQLEKARVRSAKRRADPELKEKLKAASNEYKKKWDQKAYTKKRKEDPVFLEKFKADTKARYESLKADSEKLAANKAWNAAYRKTKPYREYLKKRYLKRREDDIGFILTLNLRTRMQSILSGRLKAVHAKEVLGCTLDELKAHLESQFSDGMNWENKGRWGWHIDHIIPCAFFDMTNAENQRVCFHYLNLQPLWGSENCRKQATLPPGHEQLLAKIRIAIG